MSADEKRLALMWHAKDGMGPTAFGDCLRRSPSSISRLLSAPPDQNPTGRPRKLTKQQIDKLMKLVDRMVQEAMAEDEVTQRMILRRSRLRVSVRLIANALHERGYRFHKLREKLLLTPDDVKERYAFSKKYRKKKAAWWIHRIHVHLDNTCFKVATTERGRRILAMRNVRGAYRARKRSLQPEHVKATRKLRQNTGATGVLVGGGVSAHQTLVWHIIDGTWGSAAARKFYSDVVAPKLAATHPRRRHFTILEDNDSVGYQSKAGRVAKRVSRSSLFRIPKRSRS